MATESRRPILRGERIYLRVAEQDDVARFVEWLNDADFMETLGGRGPVSSVSEQSWFDEMQKKQGKDGWHFVICLREGDRPIGMVGFLEADLVNGMAELGLGIAERSLWDKGYGTEATRLMLDFGFGELRLHRVWLRVYEGNDRARHVYEKVGFTHEGTLRAALYRHARHRDMGLMGILRDEWLALDRAHTWEID